MNTRRILFWIGFVVLLGLIIWGLIAAINKQATQNGKEGVLPDITVADHILGAESAPVDLVEYSDFQCPACEAWFPLVERLLTEEGSSTIRFVYRHFPLSQHANAIPAALASEAASSQGYFWDMYRLLFTKHTDWEAVKDPYTVFAGYASSLGLDMQKFEADYNDNSIRSAISKVARGGTAAGVGSTPTFYVNGRKIDNPRSYEEFKSMVDAAVAVARSAFASTTSK